MLIKAGGMHCSTATVAACTRQGHLTGMAAGQGNDALAAGRDSETRTTHGIRLIQRLLGVTHCNEASLVVRAAVTLLCCPVMQQCFSGWPTLAELNTA